MERRFSTNFGALTPFWFAVTRADAERAFDRFVAEALPSFGDYQDAMLTNERFLYHSVVSLYINVGLLDPMTSAGRSKPSIARAGSRSTPQRGLSAR